jgi:hypothetical protein
MSFLDLNNEEEQQQRNYGPVPSGSLVLCRITIEKPQYSDQGNSFISRSQHGMLGLWAKIEVVAGTYAGVYWYDNIWLPISQQKVPLNDGQQTACRMGGARIKAVVEACRGISPKDDSAKAKRDRNIEILDLNGMEFPARLGISNKPGKSKDGRMFWNNIVGAVITPDKSEYKEIRNGGERITDGPVVGKESANQTQTQPSQNGYDDPGYDAPPASAYDDSVPF